MIRLKKVTLIISPFVFVVAAALLYAVSTDSTVESVNSGWIHLSSVNGDLPVPRHWKQQTASLILDIDKDGIYDFLIGARRAAPSLVWFRRKTIGWDRYIIDAGRLPIEAGGAFHDIDGDGDQDIVMGEDASGSKVYWWENPYPLYEANTPWRRYIIKNSGGHKHHDQIFGDFDGDGKAELVFWNQKVNSLFLAEIPADPRTTQPWKYSVIYTSADQSEGLAKADIDDDGKVDLVGGGHWFKHIEGTNYDAKAIDAKMHFSRAAVGQLKRGGRVEVVFVVGDGSGRLKWYEWDGAAWQGHDLLGIDVVHGHSLQIADVNNDNNLDIFCAEMHSPGHEDKATLWAFYGDGEGHFIKEVISTGIGNHESRVADLDGDGDLDILTKPYQWKAPRVDILLNRRSALDRWQRHVVDADRPWRSIFVTAADIDGDEQNDIVTGGWWYKNPGVVGGAWKRFVIGNPLYNMAAVYDFDGDGDPDILGTQGKGSKPNGQFVWARNEGSGSFSILKNVAEGDGDFLQGVAVGRLHGKDLHVALSWHAAGKGIQLLTIPVDPSNDEWAISKISQGSQDEALSIGDIDRNGGLDILMGTKYLRNLDTGWKIQNISLHDKPDRNRVIDVNGDGLLDAVVGFEAINKLGDIRWYENSNPVNVPWRAHQIARIIGPMSLDAGDVDGDNDVDIVAGEHNMADASKARLYVFENADGEGGKWISHLVHEGDEHHDGTILADIDNDKDLDIISIGWSHNRVLLYENNATENHRRERDP